MFADLTSQSKTDETKSIAIRFTLTILFFSSTDSKSLLSCRDSVVDLPTAETNGLLVSLGYCFRRGVNSFCFKPNAQAAVLI